MTDEREKENEYPKTLGLYAKSGRDNDPEKCVVVRLVRVSEFAYEITSGIVFKHDPEVDAWSIPLKETNELVTCHYKTMAYQVFKFLKTLASTERGPVLVDWLEDY